MTAFRITDPAPQFFSADGTFLLVGGSVTFYESGTTTLQNTYTDITLTTANPNPMPINSQGRISDCWGSGNYRMVVADANGNIQYTRDDVEIPGGNGQTIPTLVANEFLTNDGANLLWEEVNAVPDPTGQSGKYLTNNGSSITWGNLPAAVDPSITISGNNVQLSDGSTTNNQWYLQQGTGSCPASGGHGAATSITFPSAFAGNPLVYIMPTTNSAGSAGYFAIPAVVGVGPSGCTVTFNTNSSDGSDGNLTGPVTFNWLAIGQLAPAA